MEDTAEKVATLEELLKSTINRAEIALMVMQSPDASHLLPTILEDLYFGAQLILDEHCVKEERNG